LNKPEDIKRRGLMLVLSSPSGAGKTTIARALLQDDAELTISVSATTRNPRPGEVNGEDYFFIDKDTFIKMVEDGEFLENARVFDNLYGTPRGPVEDALAAGGDVLFDVDWQGTQQLAAAVRADLVSIFILPPSHGELERRLRGRAQDPEEVVRERMAKAGDEMSHWAEYDYVIVNDELAESISRVRAILAAERLRRDRQTWLHDFVSKLRGA
jgi:guanylate kinase